MKHILPIFLIMLIYSDAFAVVDPDGTGGLIKCANLAEEACLMHPNSCWWTPLTSIHASDADCYTCGNSPQDGFNYVSGTLAGYTQGSNINYNNFMNLWNNLDKTKEIFCPWIFTCSAGKHPVFSEGRYTCSPCDGNTYSNTEYKIMVTGKDQYWKIGANGVVGTAPNTSLVCSSCGSNAVANSDRTNCNCVAGYMTGEGRYENVGMTSCTQGRTYDIRLIPTETPGPELKIRYWHTRGYDVNGDDSFDDVGKPIYSNLSRAKYDLIGWSPIVNVDPTELEWPGFAGNTLSKKNNEFDIADYCDKNECDYNILGEIQMYAVWSPKKYSIIYKNEKFATGPDVNLMGVYGQPVKVKSNEWLKTVECNSVGELLVSVACDFEGELVPDGKLSNGWKCDNCATTDVLLAGDEIPEPADGYPADTVVLTATTSDCPVGYYCTNNEKHKCPAGSTSSLGAKSANECYLEAGFTSFCKKGTNNCIDMPMDWDRFLKYQGSSEQN